MSKDSPPFFLELGSSKIILSYSDTIHNKIITEEENILNDMICQIISLTI